ncbi:hypothetical protein PENARI_c039G02041 [Penicillium arizonense]|uniref:Uncharacterized protein n=1 Tax=Penicillium arizonense TaxID=1835702 RepID=A0A1F5L385_PENAI|nr:hypothetical protein PENARI_c039G02041 [Penicillium arizonense]OGE47642.1 hypothetical protein PENARI_c039G02041 [Penicillium arizonense]
MPYRARTYNLPSAGTGDTYFLTTAARNACENRIIANEPTTLDPPSRPHKD